MFLSVIVATYNRAQTLQKTLESILNQKTLGAFDFEIILVDNNSNDNTKEIVEALKKKAGGRLRYFFEPKQGKAFAINKGIGEAKGEILAFTDDDAVVDELWLWNIFECFKVHRCDGLGGRILPEYPQGTPQWIKDHSRKLSGPIVYYDYGEDNKKFEKPMLEFLGANFAFTKNVFEQFGVLRTDIGPGSGINLGEDTEITNRLLRARKSLYYCGKAVVWHPVDPQRMRLQYLARWYKSLGRYYVRVDGNSLPEKGLVRYWGIPRYLIREIILGFGAIPLTLSDKGKLLDVWKRLFINVGRAQEIQRIASNKGRYNE
ncbi:MAG: hypothetical protein A2787_01565 [Omnitrophica WOR_2 bacterium RIFCSPHIGHO2_01_FULL_48_9]|nr:MAG: hypothetical protein A3D10_06130 [Omnitrophica WOR_2 bacterium RIFCSPHIGHO2_02_FULL_48_11]OGX34077.1 MAG: hypothetical protein A2787_01565 [Omnitrophica WOR_2 bacterium RIFCSPHIGHO2_01_FULL_48_9]